jgi:hypothetical protein
LLLKQRARRVVGLAAIRRSRGDYGNSFSRRIN